MLFSRNRSPKSFARTRAARPRLESLEGRVVLSVSFDSVLTIGTDTASITPTDSAVDAAGNSYVTGILQRPMDFDPAAVHADGSDILTPRGSSDAYVVKYAPDNSFVWARSMGSDYIQTPGNYFERGNGVRVDGAGNVYVTGTFYQRADFGSIRLTSAGNSDAFVVKLDPNGNTLWAKGWGGANQDIGNDIAVDAAGNVVSVGSSSIPYSSNPADGWIENATELRKYSPTGAAVWSQRIASPTNGAGGVATDASGNIYVCGFFSGTADFNVDPRKTNNVSGPYGSAYVLKLTPSGAFGWVSSFVSKTAESPGSYVRFNDIAVDSSGNVFVGGIYEGQVDLNPSSSVDYRLPDARAMNGFVAKLSSTGSLAWARQTGGDTVTAVAVDTSGAVYATGYFGTEAFNPGFGLPPVTSNGSLDAYVSKFTSSGTLDWALTFGGTSSDVCYGIAVDASGAIYLAGSYGPSTVDFDPDPLTTQERTNTSFTDMFLLKLRQS